MNWYFVGAAGLAFLVGLAHTIFGEVLIFRGMRREGFVPTEGGSLLRERHVRILWASWHVVTALGWGMSGLLCWMALPHHSASAWPAAEKMIAASMLGSSILVLIGTKAKHPGWVGLLGVAALIWLGRSP